MKTAIILRIKTLFIAHCSLFITHYSLSQGSIDIDTNIQMGIAGNEHVKITTTNFSIHQDAASPLIYGDFGTGNVGIGTNSPTALLDLKANSGFEIKFSGTHQGNIYSEQNLYLLANNDLLLGSDNVDAQVFLSGGKLGIGIDPSFQLDVNGKSRLNVDAHPWDSSNKNKFFLELKSTDTGNSTSYIAIRFHQSNQYWHSIRVNGDGFHFTDANSLSNYSDLRAASFIQSSDSFYKEEIRQIVGAIELINGLQGVTFNWKENNKSSIGFIAQDVEQVLPQLVYGDEGSKGVDYSGIIPVLVEAIKELKAEKDEEIALLKAEIDNLKK